MEAIATIGLRARTLAFLRLRPRAATVVGLLATWAGVASWLAADFSGRIRDWAVMTDEMLYTKLAISVADSGSPLPRVHGTLVGVLNQLYPLLLAPFFAAFGFPTAFHAAHVFNAVLMASACVPAYLIARQVVDRWAALAVGVLSVTVPWMVLTGVLMTEPAAYPAFLWGVFTSLRAVRSPGPGNDLIAVGGLALVLLARTQFVALAVILPIAILAEALAAETSGTAGTRLKHAVGTTVLRHRVLTSAYLLAGAGALAVAIVGSLGDALGVYGTTLHGSILPSGVWRQAAAHLDTVAIGCGLVPLVLGGGWMLAVVARSRLETEHRPFAVVGLLTTAALTLETASFDVRFGGGEVVRDRYLFYAVPLLLTATMAALSGSRTRGTAIGAATLTGFFAATVHWLDFPTSTAFWVDSPERILNGTLVDASGSLGTATFVALAGAVVGLGVVVGLVVLPHRLLAFGALAFLLPFSVLTTRNEIDTVSRGNSSSGRPVAGPPGVVLDWVDSVVPGDARVAIIPFPQSPEFALDAVRWWDVEFWNRAVGQTFVGADRNFSYAPFPNRTLAPNWSSGRTAVSADAPQYVVFALDDGRFRLAGLRHAENLGLQVRLADRPYHAEWGTRGLDPDGWDRSGRPATLRVYAQHATPELVDVAVTLAAPQETAARYVLRAVGVRRSGEIAAAAAATESLSVCVRPGSYAQVSISTASSATVPGVPLSFAAGPGRRVGARVGPIETTFTGRTCG